MITLSLFKRKKYVVWNKETGEIEFETYDPEEFDDYAFYSILLNPDAIGYLACDIIKE